MSGAKAESLVQAVRRHLRNGFVILSERGIVALYGAAMREAAKIVDSPVGVFLAPREIMRDGPELVRTQGIRSACGAVLRQIAAQYDPPLGRSRNPVNQQSRDTAIRYHHTYELVKPDGVVPARRPVNDVDYALEIPFFYNPQPQSREPIAAIIHAFYVDDLQTLLARLEHFPCGVDLFLSTDTEDKKLTITEKTAGWRHGRVDVRVLPNKGRDIGAKFVGFRDVYERYELFLHLHLKKSLHGGAPLARWRDYLFDNLVGSPETIQSILSLFDDPKLGIVFPQHLFEIRGILNWGYNFDIARGLLKRIGVGLDKNLVLEFPSGSMFWGRSKAIQPLLNAGLSYEDFPEESGQVDGTIAHAIERILLMVAESRGYEWLKVVRRDLYPAPRTVLPVHAATDIAEHRLKVFQPCLTDVDAEAPPYTRKTRESRRIVSYPSRNFRPRLNLVVPTVNPKQTFGGVATAIKLFEAWCDAIGDGYDRRIIVTDAEIEPEAYVGLSGYTPTAFSVSLDMVSRALVDAKDRGAGRLDLRAREMFVATAWWTVDIVRSLERDRARYHGSSRPFVYLIQDDEPNFDGWGSRYALAEMAYRYPDETIAVINSEELYASISAKHSFAHMFCLPYSLNTRISELLSPVPRERIILVYGRPTVARNAFEIICEALRRWQQSDPIRASRWRVVFLGEAFEPPLAYPIQNAAVDGKVSLDAYADYLNRASVGIALMISPHPSYPPLEMAEAGLKTITNTFAGKDLRQRFEDIVSIGDPTPEFLAEAIEQAVEEMEPMVGRTISRKSPRHVALPGPIADPQEIGELLRSILK